MVAETGRAVPSGDPAALAQACLDILRLPPAQRRTLAAAARARVQQEYNLDGIVRQYDQLYRSLVANQK